MLHKVHRQSGKANRFQYPNLIPCAACSQSAMWDEAAQDVFDNAVIHASVAEDKDGKN